MCSYPPLRSFVGSPLSVERPRCDVDRRIEFSTRGARSGSMPIPSIPSPYAFHPCSSRHGLPNQPTPHSSILGERSPVAARISGPARAAEGASRHAAGLKIDWAYAPGQVKVLTSSDGANFEEARCWQSSTRGEVAYEESFMFDAPRSVKAVTVVMRSRRPHAPMGGL